MDDLFEGTWALVTGASSGLGEEFARQLAARRTNLVLSARSADRLEALAVQLRETFRIATEVIPLDLAQPGGAVSLCEEVERRGRTVSHLISNAGFGSTRSFLSADKARLTEMIRLNCEALTTLTQHRPVVR